MKSIIVIFTLSACVLGTAYAAPYPGSSEIALLNGMTSAEKMQGGYDFGGEMTIQERKDAEAQFLGTLSLFGLSLAVSLLFPDITNGLQEVTIQKTEDITRLEMLLANIESSSMDEEAKVQILGTIFKGALKFLPKALQLLKTGGKAALGFADKLAPGLLAAELLDSFEGEDSDDIKELQQLQKDTSSNDMKEAAEAQGKIANTIWKRLGSYFVNKTPKVIDYIKGGAVGALIGAAGDRLLQQLGLGEKMIVQTSGKAGNDHRYEKLFELLEPERGMNKEAKASFFAAGDSPGK